jgi:hypothetical protein
MDWASAPSWLRGCHPLSGPPTPGALGMMIAQSIRRVANEPGGSCDCKVLSENFVHMIL